MGLLLGGLLSEGFLRLRFGGLIFGRAYYIIFFNFFFWGGAGRAYYRNFTVCYSFECLQNEACHFQKVPFRKPATQTGPSLYNLTTLAGQFSQMESDLSFNQRTQLIHPSTPAAPTPTHLGNLSVPGVGQ